MKSVLYSLLFISTLSFGQGPQPNAGPDRVIFLPHNTVELNGAFSQRGAKPIVRYEWHNETTSEGGKTGAVIDNMHSVVTTATIPETGVYFFQLVAIDTDSSLVVDQFKVELRTWTNGRGYYTYVTRSGPDLTPTPTPDGLYVTRQSGNWSDPNTWESLTVPNALNDSFEIYSPHTVTLDQNVTISGGKIKGKLQFDPSGSDTLRSDRNIIVDSSGEIEMKPTGTNRHCIEFINVVRTAFVGGGMNPIWSDVGLWIMGNGHIDAKSPYKSPWVAASGSINAGSSGFTALTAPVNWQVGDTVVIPPMEDYRAIVGSEATKARAWTGFEKFKITSVVGTNVTWASVPTLNHAAVVTSYDTTYTPQVMNITRQVGIKGTPGKPSHKFTRSTHPQYEEGVEYVYMGVSYDRGSPKHAGNPTGTALDGVPDKTAGRYGDHMHMCHNGSQGSYKKYNVMKYGDNNAYVPHFSNGIDYIGCIVFDTYGHGYWWDSPDSASQITIDSAYMLGLKFQNRGLEVGLGGADSNNNIQGSVIGVLFADGFNNIARNVWACGFRWNQGQLGPASWPEQFHSPWLMENWFLWNNEGFGSVPWQNANEPSHFNFNIHMWHMGQEGWRQGAYVNDYFLRRIRFYKNGRKGMYDVGIAAATKTALPMQWHDVIIESDNEYVIQSRPTAANQGGPYVLMRDLRVIKIGNNLKSIFLDTLGNGQKDFALIRSNLPVTSKDSIVTYRPSRPFSGKYFLQGTSGSARQLVKASTGTAVVETSVSRFFPDTVGTGHGLKVEWFNNTDLTDKRAEYIEGSIMYLEWRYRYPHNLLWKPTVLEYSGRWSGYIQGQYNETYTFYIKRGGGVRLWLNGVLVYNAWSEVFPTEFTVATFTFTAGQKIPIVLEYFNQSATVATDQSHLELKWSSPSTPKQFVPPTQLYHE